MVMGLGSFASRVVATAVVATDGTGDFTNIQDALDSLPAGGGVIYIKEGTYTITSAFTISTDNVVIIGAGRSTILEFTFNDPFITITGDDFRIEGVLIKGNNTGIAQDGIVFSTANRGSVVGCWIEDMGQNAINIGAGSDITIANNFIRNNTGRGIITSTNTPRLIITGNVIKDNTRFGILAVGISDSVIDSNIINSNGDSGIFFNACDDNIISNNVIGSNGDWGINIFNAACDKNIIMGNHILNNTTGAVNDSGTNTHPNGASGTNNLALDDLNIIA